MTGGTSMPNVSAWPTRSTSTAPASRGALLAGVDERRLDDRRDDLVEVGVRIDDHAVLAAHLGDDALDVRLAVGRLGGGADDLEADGAGAGEGDRVDARVPDERGACVAEAGHEVDRSGGCTGLQQRLDDDLAACR
jgi:hypothetical protein